ncbi:MAG: DUF371 domain-containing protein [Candidatus Woesearchaeota archaeon]
MKVSFSAFGHPNITATHKTTLEITSDSEVSASGTCIIGVRAKIPDLRCFLDKPSIIILLKVAGLEDKIRCVPNPSFQSDKELVVRMGEFKSPRTFGLRADKASRHIDRRIAQLLKDSSMRLQIEVTDEA